VIPVRLERGEVTGRPPAEMAGELQGLVLVEGVGREPGEKIRKGTTLDREAAERLLGFEWDELHLLRPEAGDVHEEEAGRRLARAVAGKGMGAGEFAGGAWPLRARSRGILEVAVPALEAVNALEGLTVFTHLDGRIVDRGEEVARAKVIPFLVPGERVRGAEERAKEAGNEGRGVLSVRPFRSLRVGAVVQESLASASAERFRDAMATKLGWFGAEGLEPRFVEPEVTAVARASEELLEEGAQLLLVAGARAMDPLDPAFGALDRMGAERVRHGVPAHPGSLLWVARIEGVPVVGVPSCGLFSRATVFDLVLARILAGLPVEAADLARMGHGGFLTPEMNWRFPAYREEGRRGEVG